MKIKKLTNKEIKEWQSKQPPIVQFSTFVTTPVDIVQLLNRFQSEIYKRNLIGVKVIKSLECSKCHAAYKIPETEILDIQYYVEPYSCTAGDYWLHQHYGISCTCGRMIEISDKDYYALRTYGGLEKKAVEVCERKGHFWALPSKLKYRTIHI
jgi:hypothetical protein